MNVSARQARAFMQLAHHRSFTRAAVELNLSQPALTVQIRKLEEALGVQLFERSTRMVELTPVGRELVPIFRRIVQDLDSIVRRANEAAKRYDDTIRVACVPSIASTLLPNMISIFLKENPRVEVLVSDVVWSRVLATIRSGEVEFGIGAPGPDAADLDAISLMEDHMHVVFPARHPLSRERDVTLNTILQYPLVLTGKDSNVRMEVDSALAAQGHFAVPVREVGHSSSAIGLVSAGFGVAILPATLMELRAAPRLRSKPIIDCVRRIAILKKSGRRLSSTHTKLVAFLIHSFSKLSPG